MKRAALLLLILFAPLALMAPVHAHAEYTLHLVLEHNTISRLEIVPHAIKTDGGNRYIIVSDKSNCNCYMNFGTEVYFPIVDKKVDVVVMKSNKSIEHAPIMWVHAKIIKQSLHTCYLIDLNNNHTMIIGRGVEAIGVLDPAYNTPLSSPWLYKTLTVISHSQSITYIYDNRIYIYACTESVRIIIATHDARNKHIIAQKEYMIYLPDLVQPAATVPGQLHHTVPVAIGAAGGLVLGIIAMQLVNRRRR